MEIIAAFLTIIHSFKCKHKTYFFQDGNYIGKIQNGPFLSGLLWFVLLCFFCQSNHDFEISLLNLPFRKVSSSIHAKNHQNRAPPKKTRNFIPWNSGCSMFFFLILSMILGPWNFKKNCLASTQRAISCLVIRKFWMKQAMDSFFSALTKKNVLFPVWIIQ